MNKIKTISLLLIEDSIDDEQLLLKSINDNSYKTEHKRVDTQIEFESMIKLHSWDVIICDCSILKLDVFKVLAYLTKRKIDIPFIIISNKSEDETIIEVIKAGANDFIRKDNLSRLLPSILKEIKEAAERKISKKAQKKIIEMNKELIRVNSELKKSDKVKSELLANVSHELRTPLLSIMGFTGLLLTEDASELNKKQKQHLKTVLRNSDRLLLLIENLLDFSKIDSGKDKLFIERFNFSVLCSQAIKMINIKSRKKNILIIKNPDKNLKYIYADREKILRLLLNLLDNAVKFSNKDTEIILETECLENNKFMLSVLDSGPGIPRLEKKKIFERFYQVDSSRTRVFDGIGLGLAICENIVSLHLGTISVKDLEKGGTVFSCILPIKN